MTTKIDIKWDDDDGSFEAEFADANRRLQADDEFLQLLEQGGQGELANFRVGDKVKGIISSISAQSDDVTVEIGTKTSAVMAKQELQDPDNPREYHAGDEIEAFVVSKSGGEIVLGRSMSHKVAKDQALDAAFAGNVPVKGKVIKANKGGFDIQVMGKTGFCPVSQIDTRFVKDDEKESYVGKEFEFLIEKMDGRNLVVSRSVLLRRYQAEQLERIKSRLESDPIFDGNVTELRDFGAMVEFSGITGMVHISEVSHSRVAHVSEALQVGQKVRVKVLNIDEQKGLPRISLSIKQAGEDPWVTQIEALAVGQSYPGRVRRLETFGAFVELSPGVEGLIHVSEMAWGKRIHHPKDILTVGDTVNVRILAIDTGAKRISLSLKAIDDDPWLRAERELTQGTLCKGKVLTLKNFGAIVDLDRGLTGLLPTSVLKAAYGDAYRKQVTGQKEVDVVVGKIDLAARKILLSLPNLAETDDPELDFQEYLKAEKSRGASDGPKPNSVGSFGELLSQSLNRR